MGNGLVVAFACPSELVVTMKQGCLCVLQSTEGQHLKSGLVAVLMDRQVMASVITVQYSACVTNLPMRWPYSSSYDTPDCLHVAAVCTRPLRGLLWCLKSAWSAQHL